MGRSPADFLRKHPVFMRTLVLGYTAFLCCFFFPLGSSPPLHRVILFGLMVLCLVEAYGPGRERDVFFRVLAAAAAGLLGRYLLEYGEVSNTRNFTAENVLFFLLTVPAGMTAAYHFLVKFLLPKSRGGGAQSAERRTSA